MMSFNFFQQLFSVAKAKRGHHGIGK